MDLTLLPKRQRARICRIEADDSLTRKLLEMGLEEGAELTLLHEGPVRRDPLAVSLHDRIIALRRRDAKHILVEPVN